MKFERKSERQYVPKVTPTALARVGAVADRDMILILLLAGSFFGVCDEQQQQRLYQGSKSFLMDPPMVSHIRSVELQNFSQKLRKLAEDDFLQ